MPSVIIFAPASLSWSTSTTICYLSILLSAIVLFVIQLRVLIESSWVFRPFDIEPETTEVFILQIFFSLFSMPIIIELNKCKSFLRNLIVYSEINFTWAIRLKRILKLFLCHFLGDIAYKQTHLFLSLNINANINYNRSLI